jgi:Trypsin-co-occurring domain 1
MKRLIEFPLEDGGTVLVESDEPETTGPVTRGSSPREMVEKAEQTFETALDKIKPVAAAFIAKVRELTDAPGEVGIEFGIKLGAKAGAFIASADAEATFKVTLTWKREQNEKTA